MSEITESYEDLVKQLKPLSVILDKISDQRLATLRVVDDPNRINDEPIFIPDKPDNEEKEGKKEEEEEEQEIEIDLKEAMAAIESGLEEDPRNYSCFFCKKLINGYKEIVVHYQLHIDYYPIQCSVCDEANPDILAFIKHCQRIHPELERAKYLLKENPIFFDWIHNFLNTEINILVHKYCPVCDWTHLMTQPEEPSPKAIPILRHIHEHIKYMPFECIKCRENDRQFRVHYLDNEIRGHIKAEHKELEPPFWQHFSKRFSIPSLDKFIANYLNILGIKLPKKRSTRRRSKPTLPSLMNGQTPQPIVLTNSSSNNSVTIQPKAVSISMNTTPITMFQKLLLPMKSLITNQAMTQMVGPKSVITMGSPVNRTNNPLHMETPLLMLPSSNMLNLKPFYVESIDLGLVCVDPKIIEIEDKLFKYICVFCDEEKVFQSKVEMSVHFSIHFSYYPIVCMLCEKTFVDLSTLIYHYTKSHYEYRNNLFHYFKEDDKIEKWINDFVNFQKTHEFRGNVSVAFGDHCFVCQKMAKNDTSFRMNLEKNKIKAVRDHIHQHLNYFPYRCLVCFHGNREVRFTSFNESAKNHFIKIHGLNLREILETNVSKLLAKTNEILILEKFIDNKLFPKREKTMETPITLNLKRKLEEIEMDMKKRLETSGLMAANSLPALPSAQVLPMIRYENNKPETPFPYKPSTSLLRINTISSPQKVLKKCRSIITINFLKLLNGIHNIRVTAPAVKPKVNPIEYIPNRMSYIEPYLHCFHCHKKVSNTKELESHHQLIHPMLTIASYAPTRRDLIINSK